MDTLVESLKWDSEFFGVPIGRIVPRKLDEVSMRTVQTEAQIENLRCLYFEADPNDQTTVVTVERHGFHLVDVRVVLEYPFHDRPAPALRYSVPEELIIDSPRENELGQLQDISAQIGLHSRFNFDTRFAPGSGERLYRLWIQNACQGFADVVMVARWTRGGDAVGLITCVLHNGVGHIQLAGVHLDHRQRGIGTGLVQAALEWSKMHGGSGMQVATQARNVPAQRLYQQMGFFTKTMTIYYHKWL